MITSRRRWRVPKRVTATAVALAAVFALGATAVPAATAAPGPAAQAAPAHPATAPGPAKGKATSRPDRSVSKAQPLPEGDEVVDGGGDTDGYHLYAADSADGWTWHALATLQPDRYSDEAWIGQQCLTGDGRTVVAVVAPWHAGNDAAGMDGGGIAYAVDAHTGAVRPLAGGVSLAYFNPGCGADGDVALTTYLDADQSRTRVTVLDAATGEVVRTSTTAEEITGATAVGNRTVGARGDELVDITGNRPAVLGHLTGQAAELRPSADGGLDLLSRAGAARSQIWHWTPAGLRQTGSGPLERTHLFAGEGGHNFVAGTGEVTAGGPKALAATGVEAVSARGGRIVIAPTVAPGSKAATSLSASVLTAPTAGTARSVRLPAPAARPVTALPALSLLTAPRAGSVAAATNGVEPDTTSPGCAVPRNDIYQQVWQPTSDQVRWAVLEAVQGGLTDPRPPNATDTMLQASDGPAFSPLPTSAPSTDYPLLSADVRVPPLVMYGILAQESNWSQASWHALPGRSGNPLIADYYGDGLDPGTIDYASSDCGYGIGQVTDAMQAPVGGGPPTARQVRTAVDYATNIAASVQILQAKWEDLHTEANVPINDDDPTRIENWYGAIWAYNTGVHTGPDDCCGLGWLNNPANPIYPYNRHTFLHMGTTPTLDDAKTPSAWPYQERVFGWMEVPQVDGDGYLKYDGTYDWNDRTGTFLSGPSHGAFCAPSNGCDPKALGPDGDPCPTDDSTCYWDAPVTWDPDCAQDCIVDTPTEAPGGHVDHFDGEPASTPAPAPCYLIRTSGLLDDHESLPPGTVLIDDETLADQNPEGRTPNLMNCPGQNSELQPPAGSNAHFALEDSAGRPVDGTSTPSSAAGIDLHQLGGGLGGHLFFTHSTDSAAQEVRGVWSATVPPGFYEVRVFVPDVAGTDQQATYTVDGGSGSPHTDSVDQDAYTNQWITVATQRTSGTMTVSLSSLEAGATGDDLAYDAVALVPWSPPKLLLVHGFSDSCSAFDQTDRVDPGEDAQGTKQFLAANGYTSDDVTTVGYYDPDISWDNPFPSRGPSTFSDASPDLPANGLPQDCDTNVRTNPVSGQDAVSNCSGYVGANGYTDDELEHLACMMAWYIADNADGRPVDILAHSMGGLVVRGALAFSGPAHHQAGFPMTDLPVGKVITVGTPHAGLSGLYAGVFNAFEQDSANRPLQQVKDMTVCPDLAASCTAGVDIWGVTAGWTLQTSPFMKALIPIGTPRGADNAQWYLMGSSIPSDLGFVPVASNVSPLPVVINNANAATSALNMFGGDRYPDTDWVVQSTSTLGMAADFKVLYGAVEEDNGLTVTTDDSGGVRYSHEGDTCQTLDPTVEQFLDKLFVLPDGLCTQSPYYLTDADPDPTSAWVCTEFCTGTEDFSDMPIPGGATTVPRSLDMILSMLQGRPGVL